jgi:hypothetical protein
MEVGSQNLGGGGQLQGSNPHSHKDDYTSRGSEEEEKQVDFNSFKQGAGSDNGYDVNPPTLKENQEVV